MARRGSTRNIEVTKQFLKIAGAQFRRLYLFSRSERGAMSFRKLKTLFEFIYGYWPPEGLPLTNIDPLDEFRLTADVPPSRLHGPIPKELQRDRLEEIACQ